MHWKTTTKKSYLTHFFQYSLYRGGLEMNPQYVSCLQLKPIPKEPYRYAFQTAHLILSHWVGEKR